MLLICDSKSEADNTYYLLTKNIIYRKKIIISKKEMVCIVTIAKTLKDFQIKENETYLPIIFLN